MSINSLRRAFKTASFHFFRLFALLFTGISLAFAIAAAADLLLQLGWGANWQTIPGGLAMAAIGIAFHRFIGLISPLVDRVISVTDRDVRQDL